MVHSTDLVVLIERFCLVLVNGYSEKELTSEARRFKALPSFGFIYLKTMSWQKNGKGK